MARLLAAVPVPEPEPEQAAVAVVPRSAAEGAVGAAPRWSVAEVAAGWSAAAEATRAAVL